jgi:hypothetical protein
MKEFKVRYKTVLMYWKDQMSKSIKVFAKSENDAEYFICDQFDGSCLAETIYECEVIYDPPTTQTMAIEPTMKRKKL